MKSPPRQAPAPMAAAPPRPDDDAGASRPRILAVVPARGGSKGIPRKNVRLMAGEPLIHHVLRTALAVNVIDDVVVTSDDAQILRVAQAFDARVHLHERGAHLAGDEVTLDPVVHDAVEQMERQSGAPYDLVLTLQPTSPTLRPATLAAAIATFDPARHDALLSAVDDTHLRWRVPADAPPRPLYEERKNRQWLPQEARETGAFVISRRDVVTTNGRLGTRTTLHIVPPTESVDLDTGTDWLIAETLLSRLRIHILVNARPEIGFGHLYNQLTVADTFLGHDVQFHVWDSAPQVPDLVRARGHRCNEHDEIGSVLAAVDDADPDIVVYDILDSDRDLVRKLRGDADRFVVGFEDLGPGSKEAHLVFNAIYEASRPPDTHRFGASWVCLDHAFLIEPRPAFRERATRLMCSFGGADEQDMTGRLVRNLPRLLQTTALEVVDLVIGPGYAHHAALDAALEALPTEVRDKVRRHQVVKNMAHRIAQADVGVTSNGRTVYEFAAMGVPAVTIAQNDRETSHLFARYTEGMDYLGMAIGVDDDQLVEHIAHLANDPTERRRRREALLAEDLRQGAHRVHEEIVAAQARHRAVSSAAARRAAPHPGA